LLEKYLKIVSIMHVLATSVIVLFLIYVSVFCQVNQELEKATFIEHRGNAIYSNRTLKTVGYSPITSFLPGFTAKLYFPTSFE
jgi:hypothetical protein